MYVAVFKIQWNLSIKDTLATLFYVLIIEVSSIKRLLNALQYYTGTQNGVLIIESFSVPSFVAIERFCYMDMLFDVYIVHTYVRM